MKNFIPTCVLFTLSIVLISSKSFAQDSRDPGSDPYDTSNNMNMVSKIPATSLLSLADNPSVYLSEKPEGIPINKNETKKKYRKSFLN
jgi:hypothetical protein